jgi:hypothetical protein
MRSPEISHSSLNNPTNAGGAGLANKLIALTIIEQPNPLLQSPDLF